MHSLFSRGCYTITSPPAIYIYIDKYFVTFANLLPIGAVLHAVVLQLPEELYSEDAVQGHEEEEEDGDVVHLLTGSSVVHT